MKILHCVEYYYPHIGGAEKHVQILSEGYSKLGHECHVATTKINYRQFKRINKVKIIEFDIQGNSIRGYQGDTSAYQEFLLNNNYDLIVFYAAQQWSFDLSIEILEKIKARKIFIPCGFSKLNKTIYKLYYRNLTLKINQFDKIICFSKSLQDYLFLKNIYKKKIDVIYNGAFQIKKKKKIFKNKFQDKTNNITLINIANFKFNKGQYNVLKVVENLKFKKFSLFFIGTNIKKNMYYYFVKIRIFFILKKNPNAEIKILNNINKIDTLAAYNECDYFIHGSNFECSPLVLFETLAAGKIYLGLEVGNVKEILNKIEIGYCNKKLNNITNKLDYYISNNYHKSEIIKKKILKKFSKNFNWKNLLKEYQKIYLNKRIGI